MNNIPNLFIIGAPKSGTTALANNLAQHNEIFISEKKEPRYFDRQVFYDNKKDYPIKDLEAYLNLFQSDRAANSKYRMDASVFNMYSKESIKNILKLSSNAKFIVVLRDPVSAALSMHKQRLKYSDTKMREISENFMVCWNTLEDRKNGKGYPKGCKNKFLFRYDLLYSYELYLPYIISTVPKKNLFIGFYDDFIQKPDLFYKNIFNFLEIDIINIENKKLNESVVLKKSLLLSLLQNAAEKTFLIRSKVGLTGGILSKLKEKIINKQINPSFKKQYVSNEVYKYFEKTNLFLKNLKRDYKLND